MNKWGSHRYAVFDTIRPLTDLLPDPVGARRPLGLDKRFPLTQLVQFDGGFSLGVLVSW